jgi:hypothetical protein
LREDQRNRQLGREAQLSGSVTIVLPLAVMPSGSVGTRTEIAVAQGTDHPRTGPPARSPFSHPHHPEVVQPERPVGTTFDFHPILASYDPSIDTVENLNAPLRALCATNAKIKDISGSLPSLQHLIKFCQFVLTTGWGDKPKPRGDRQTHTDATQAAKGVFALRSDRERSEHVRVQNTESEDSLGHLTGLCRTNRLSTILGLRKT